MLLRLRNSVENGIIPVIKKYANGEDASVKGAFSLNTRLRFCVECNRRLGVAAVVLRINRDGEAYADMPLKYVNTNSGVDLYEIEIVLNNTFCKGNDGLFYYEILFLRGFDTLFTDSVNNVDFTLSNFSKNKFRLLVYEQGYETPKWFHGGIMYQIFADRFFSGKEKTAIREDAVINNDWYGGVKQFAEYPGAPVKNNEFFGGDLWGVAKKLDYLKTLGVNTVYLNPIFKAYSNHKYDTGDYMQVDEMFGGEAALKHLIDEAEKRDIKIILDGVFNHTGSDSIYFNKEGKYSSVGAYQSESSPYFDWYYFKKFPDKYESWWGIDILPKLNLRCKACRDFLCNKGGVVDKYTQMGIGGWRLDVADELSDDFLDILRKTVKQASKGEGIVIGEVWENAADKIAYGKRRRYFRGKQLDSVMNYPIRNGIISFVLDGNSTALYNTLTELYSSYPETVCHSLMNSLGTHDTERILSVLGACGISKLDNNTLSTYKMTKEQRALAVVRLKIASVLQYTVFGVPSVYYGDEAGLEGGHDPFCRQPYPWGKEDEELRAHYILLGQIRKERSVFSDGTFRILKKSKGFIVYERYNSAEHVVIAANVGKNPKRFALNDAVDLISGKKYNNAVPPLSAVVLKVN